jgi:hypothetical protein
MTAPTYRLITSVLCRDDPIAEFTRLADEIQRRDRCRRVVALQRAADEIPREFDAYCRALGTDP